MSTYRISQLAGRTRTPATTLRYWEQEGLVPAARTGSGYRVYTDADVDRVRFITAAKHLGLPLDQIRDLLAVWDGGMCRDVRDELRPMIAAQVDAAGERIDDLRIFRDRLAGALTHLRQLPARDEPCDPGCAFLDDQRARVPAPDTPAVACSLGGDAHAERIVHWRRLVGDSEREHRPDGGLTVRLPADLAGPLAELVVAEQRCCPFLTFDLAFRGAHLELTAHAPHGAEPLVAALFGTEDRSPC